MSKSGFECPRISMKIIELRIRIDQIFLIANAIVECQTFGRTPYVAKDPFQIIFGFDVECMKLPSIRMENDYRQYIMDRFIKSMNIFNIERVDFYTFTLQPKFHLSGKSTFQAVSITISYYTEPIYSRTSLYSIVKEELCLKHDYGFLRQIESQHNKLVLQVLKLLRTEYPLVFARNEIRKEMRKKTFKRFFKVLDRTLSEYCSRSNQGYKKESLLSKCSLSLDDIDSEAEELVGAISDSSEFSELESGPEDFGLIL